MKKFLLSVILCFFSMTAFALDQVAKEETTPPSAEGALTPEQTLPLSQIGKSDVQSTPDQKQK